ncbi:hypothetical protein ISCGN_015264 [Ixodes scapularis]
MRGAVKRLRCSVRLGYCATEAHSWARSGASASAAAMTSLLWNAKTGEAGGVGAAAASRGSHNEPCLLCEPCSLCGSRGAVRRAHYVELRRRRRALRIMSTAHYEGHAKLLNLGQGS